MAEQILIYTDGACIPNPGKGGWAYLNVTTGKSSSGTVMNTTNNRMELLAICKALLAVESPSNILVRTDSQYSILISKKASRPVKNPDLWELLHELCAFHNVKFEWVKGHSTDAYNNRVDEMANSRAS